MWTSVLPERCQVARRAPHLLHLCWTSLVLLIR